MQVIQDNIKSGQFKQVYLLYGAETYLCKQYRDKLKKALSPEGDTMNTHYFEGKSVVTETLIDLAETMPFFADRRVIVLENTGLFSSAGEKMAEYIEQIAPSAYFVFVEESVDKRSKLYKTIEKVGHAAAFEEQDERTLKHWVAAILKKDGLNITENDCEYFLEKVGNDMGCIKLELEKLVCYLYGENTVTREAIDAVCVTRLDNHIWDMIGAIGERKTEKALNLYYELIAMKEQPAKILYNIARQMNQLLEVKMLSGRGRSNTQIGDIIGLKPFIVGKLSGQASRFKESTLRNAVEKCVEMDHATKSGKLDAYIAVEMLIMSALG